VACLRATRCILMTWDFISQNLEVVKGTFATTLRAVCVWVESEANLDVLLRVLDNCFKNFYDKDPSIAQVCLTSLLFINFLKNKCLLIPILVDAAGVGSPNNRDSENDRILFAK